MFKAIESTTLIPGIDWERLEPIVARFEAACQRRPWPEIDDYLPAEEDPARRALLIELIHADLELRWRAGEPVSARAYLERYPELAGDAAASGELVAREAELRRGGDQAEPPQTLGRFQLLEIIGHGTFAFVYKAVDTELDRVVAIKVPRQGHLVTDRQASRFLREARHVARLRHPAIVPVHEAGRIDGVCFLVSNYIEGTTLAERLARGPIPARDAAGIVARMADALDHAHGQGIIHRDIKPSNILLDPVGNPHLTDFGLARCVVDSATLSTDGKIRGTPAYLSPEQAQGDGGQVDVRSDLYSLGVVLYELLTGEVPFRGSLRMVLMQVLEEDPRPPRRSDESIPRDLETICLKAMAKEPARRYPTAAALAADLRRFLDGHPVQARPLSRAGRLLRWCRRRPRLAAMAMAASLAVLGMSWQWYRAEAHLAEATRQHRLFRRALENSGRVTSSILRMVAGSPEKGSLANPIDFDRALEQMKQHIALIRDDPESQPTLALTYEQVSILLCKAGRLGPACEAMRQAVAAWDEQLSRHPDTPAYMYSLALACWRMAEEYRTELAADERRRLLDRAGALYQTAGQIIAARRSIAIAARVEWERQFHDLAHMGKLAKAFGRTEEALGWFRAAVAHWNSADPGREAVSSYARQRYLAAHAELASLCDADGRPADAFPHYLAWRDLLAAELRDRPEDPVARRKFAGLCLKIGLARREAGRLDEALEDLQRARSCWETLPPDPSRQRLKERARICVEIGRTEDRQGRYAEAIVSFRRAKAWYEALLQKPPLDPKDRQGVAMCDHAIGNLQCDLAQFAEAAASFRRALKLKQALVHDFPDQSGFATDLNGTRRRLTEVTEQLAGG
jgi:tetratricopeptide (TPR) repeat protein/tRNA A-37 threonylcarbamoyl transferase component Bud32